MTNLKERLATEHDKLNELRILIGVEPEQHKHYRKSLGYDKDDKRYWPKCPVCHKIAVEYEDDWCANCTKDITEYSMKLITGPSTDCYGNRRAIRRTIRQYEGIYPY